MEKVAMPISWPFLVFYCHYVGTFYSHLVHFWSFGIFPFWYVVPRKIRHP
jgi:hypothetical protein